MRRLAAEVFGTFALVFAGTGAIVINDVSGGTVSHVGIALTFGLVVLAMIYAVGDVSGLPPEPRRHARLLRRPPLRGPLGRPVHRQPVRRRGARQPRAAAHVPDARHARRDAARRATPLQSFVLEFILTLHPDVRDPQRLDRLEGEGRAGRASPSGR